MGRKSRSKFAEPCYWCGGRSTGRDHVIPQSFFVRPLPANLITVPACDDHNRFLALDEEYLRLLIVAGRAFDRPEGQRLWYERVLPSLQRSPALARRITRGIREVDLIRPSGLYAGVAHAFEAEDERVERVIEKVVRGLYLHERGERLSPAARVEIWHEPTEILLEYLHTARRRELGGGVVRYAYHVAGDRPQASVWWLQFYDSTFFVAMTVPEDSIAAADEPG